MATEKDIKRFFQESKPHVSNSEEFMADLIRQINLLPVPASLRQSNEEKLHEQRNLLEKFAKASRRETIFTIITSMLQSLALCIVITIIISIIPENIIGSVGSELFSKYGINILSILFTWLTIYSCLRSDFFKI